MFYKPVRPLGALKHSAAQVPAVLDWKKGPLPAASTLEKHKVNWCAAAAAKLLQSCLTQCDPIDSSPPGSSVHRILWARILEPKRTVSCWICFLGYWRWEKQSVKLSLFTWTVPEIPSGLGVNSPGGESSLCILPISFNKGMSWNSEIWFLSKLNEAPPLNFLSSAF